MKYMIILCRYLPLSKVPLYTKYTWKTWYKFVNRNEYLTGSLLKPVEFFIISVI